MDGGGAADAVVGEAQGGHAGGFVEVAAVEDDGVVEEAAHDFEVGVSELVPLGGDGEGVGAFEAAVGAVAVGQAVAVEVADVGGGFGVVDADAGAGGEEGVDEDEGGGFADVVGLGLEGEAPDGEGLARRGRRRSGR